MPFDYSALPDSDRETIKASAARINSMLKRSVDDIIAIGKELAATKAALPHGQFMPWVEAEFGWSPQMTSNFVNVASKFQNFGNLEHVAPSAAYLLAAPSTPDEAREEAIARADAGEKITHSLAKEIVAACKQSDDQPKTLDYWAAAEKLHKTVGNVRNWWPSDKLSALADQLRDIAAGIEQELKGI